METVLEFDGTFDGFLTTVFEVYNLKLQHPLFSRAGDHGSSLFGEMMIISTNLSKSKRVAYRLLQLCGKTQFNTIYHAFLSEIDGIESHLWFYLQRTFKEGKPPTGDLGDKSVLEISKASKIFHREKHRMEAFIRFHLIDDNLYFANCEPDCNVLPIIATHFKNRYADQRWVIYDLKRDYGISYDLDKVSEVEIDFKESLGNTRGIRNVAGGSDSRFRESENNYRHLWNQYFKSVNIESRKNMKLHLQHVPRRYWKYLSEKM
ncbi:MAG: TIGR03915 family putative DNA repair protein [Nonlabens sp.]